MISDCQWIKYIQFIHFIMVSVILTAPFTFYRPLIALSVYILIPFMLLSYFIFDGKCWFNMITDSIYDGEPDTYGTRSNNCPDSDNIEDYWLFNKCKQNNIFAMLSVILVISLFVLYPPTSNFGPIFNDKFRWYNLVMIIVVSVITVMSIIYKSTMQMNRYPDCNQ